ncbi:MAG TPA: penicillin-binding transpeptidase domain-containing protein [Gammaproteobacteria bacterium]|jgi:cell division protein FtsI (penicillin-binding protein 3)|nr:penicillin-binding transpeptidase domain-containing protein [Gammaproteobacteria bacterium]
MNRTPDQNLNWNWRSLAAMAVFLLAALVLLSRAIYLQVVDQQFLQTQGQERHLRVVEVAAHRGMILDRNGEPLAVSTPVDSIWMNPKELSTATQHVPELAKALDMRVTDVNMLLRQNQDKEFVYLVRGMDPYVAQKVIALNIPGVYAQREYRRYYPTGEVTAHVLGFTNVDDRGQEGLELGYNDWLRGIPGAERVIVDRFGHSVQDVENLRSPRPGKDLTTSIDLRVQYLAYRALKQAVMDQNAKSGSIIVMDAKTGEVLAMANQPSFNPNNRGDYRGDLYRNRAVTDQFEPGSSMKPFTIIAALLSGKYSPGSIVNTSPGFYKVSGYTIHDEHDYGAINLTTIIEKSSNVGASKIALSLPPQLLWSTLSAFGFGRTTGSGFPGEVPGSLPAWQTWSQARQATISYGYGVAITALQLADAYDTLADEGIQHPPSFVRLDQAPAGERVIPVSIDQSMRGMLETVVSDAGTGARADVVGYHVAGKTGTAHIAENGGYSDKRYISVFAGMAPATNPRLVAVVVIRDPSKGEYYASTVAAPVFAKVMTGALRLLDIPPDDLSHLTTTAYVVNLRHPT